MTEEFPII